jgi:hypothetical protein
VTGKSIARFHAVTKPCIGFDACREQKYAQNVKTGQKAGFAGLSDLAAT